MQIWTQWVSGWPQGLRLSPVPSLAGIAVHGPRLGSEGLEDVLARPGCLSYQGPSLPVLWFYFSFHAHRFLNTSQVGTRLSEANKAPQCRVEGLSERILLRFPWERGLSSKVAKPWREGSRQAGQLPNSHLLPRSPAVIRSGSFLLSALISVSN